MIRARAVAAAALLTATAPASLRGPARPRPPGGGAPLVRAFSVTTTGGGSSGASSRPRPAAAAANADAGGGGGPTIEQALSAASYIRTQLDSQILSSSNNHPASLSDGGSGGSALLDDLHAVASDLLDLGAHSAAADCFRYSLEQFDPKNAAVRERLSASLRGMGLLEESAEELYGVLTSLKDDGAEGREAVQSCLYVDLGHLIEEAAPLPGSGIEWDVVVEDERDAPRIRLGAGGAGAGGVRGEAVGEEIIIIGEADDEDRGECGGSGGGECKGEGGEELSALDCYRRALELDSTNGLARKRLADALAVLGRDEEALREFRRAAELLPSDVCCATHVRYGAGAGRELLPLKMASGSAASSIEDMSSAKDAIQKSADSVAEAFERDGVVVLPSFLEASECETLMSCVREALDGTAESYDGANEDDDGDARDFTSETRNPSHRVHMALAVGDDSSSSHDVISRIVRRLYPLLCRILQSDKDKDLGASEDESAGTMPLLGAGFMQVHPGAEAQELHKDVHHYDRHGPVDGMPPGASPRFGGPRTVSVQLQLTDTVASVDGATTGSGRDKMGSLEVLPGSHRPDGPSGHPSTIRSAVQGGEAPTVAAGSGVGAIPVNVPRGSVTVYSSRLWHRGGPNESADGSSPRTFCFLTVTEPGSPAPPGLIHTMTLEDVGRWAITAKGLERRSSSSRSSSSSAR